MSFILSLWSLSRSHAMLKFNQDIHESPESGKHERWTFHFFRRNNAFAINSCVVRLFNCIVNCHSNTIPKHNTSHKLCWIISFIRSWFSNVAFRSYEYLVHFVYLLKIFRSSKVCIHLYIILRPGLSPIRWQLTRKRKTKPKYPNMNQRHPTHATTKIVMRCLFIWNRDFVLVMRHHNLAHTFMYIWFWSENNLDFSMVMIEIIVK